VPQTNEERLDQPIDELASERALRTIVENMPSGVIAREAPSGKLLFANERAAQLLGPDPSGDGSGWTDQRGFALDGHEYGPDEGPLARSMRSGEIVEAETIRLERADGSHLYVEARSAPIRDDAGRISAAVVIFDDVTERQERARAEHEFVTNAAHELRTPLTAIVSAVEVLQGGAKENPEDRDRFLDHIEHETARLARLMHALLILARAQTELEDPKLELVGLEPVVREIAAGIDHGPEVEVEVVCPPDLGVIANRPLLEQALGSLTSNASRYTSSGRIALKATATVPNRVTISITDTGEGFPPEVKDRLFERFYRAQRRDGGGFGLGLAIARQAVEALRGTLEIESEQGCGTVARVTLPAARIVRP
jgi:signal transduction histidine kinase